MKNGIVGKNAAGHIGALYRKDDFAGTVDFKYEEDDEGSADN